MMIILILGIFIILVGIFLLIAPGALSRASQFLNRKMFDDSAVLSHRLLVAVICIAVGLSLLWIYFGHHVVVMGGSII